MGHRVVLPFSELCVAMKEYGRETGFNRGHPHVAFVMHRSTDWNTVAPRHCGLTAHGRVGWEEQRACEGGRVHCGQVGGVLCHLGQALRSVVCGML